MRVEGTAKKSSLHIYNVHPILLGEDGNITKFIVEFYHKKVAHDGRGLTINEIRSSFFKYSDVIPLPEV